jgi:unsaturated chondroitin disaccharide hydrolase
LARLTGRDAYRIQAETLLHALIRDCMEPDPDRPGLLRHSAQHVPHGHTPDGYTIFGDYFFLEALLTATDSPPDFWGKQDNK